MTVKNGENIKFKDMDIDIIFSNLGKADKVSKNCVIFGGFKVIIDMNNCYIYENEILLQITDIGNEIAMQLQDMCVKEMNRRKSDRLKEFENQLKKIKG